MAKVLVIDDEANLRKVLAALLRRDGYEVTVAQDGAEGLVELEKSGADVVVTDLVMPKLGRMDVLKAVNATAPDVPVIIITAHGTVDSAVEAIKPGAFDYVTKPFEQDRALGSHRQGGAQPRECAGQRPVGRPRPGSARRRLADDAGGASRSSTASRTRPRRC